MVMYAQRYGGRKCAVLNAEASTNMAPETKRVFSVAEAQKILLKKWENFRPTVPIGLTTKTRISTRQFFLIISGTKVHLPRSRERRSSGITAGFSLSAGIPGLFNLAGNVSYSNTYAPEDLTARSEVASIYDAVELVSEPTVDFPTFNDGGGGNKPTPQGLREHPGAILLVCMLLKERAKPSGRFKNCLVNGESDETQLVKFDLPLSSGVVCSTFATKNKNQTRPTLIPGGPDESQTFSEWYKANDHGHPVVTGVESECVCAELNDWANEVEKQGPIHERRNDEEIERGQRL